MCWHVPAGPRKTGELSSTHATGCGLMKGQGDPPLKPDSEYPPWLWDLLIPEPTGKDLAGQYEGLGLSVKHVSLTSWNIILLSRGQ